MIKFEVIERNIIFYLVIEDLTLDSLISFNYFFGSESFLSFKVVFNLLAYHLAEYFDEELFKSQGFTFTFNILLSLFLQFNFFLISNVIFRIIVKSVYQNGQKEIQENILTYEKKRNEK